MEGFAARSGIDLAEIQARVARERACPKHRFEIGAGPYAMGVKYQCAHCGAQKRLMDIGDYIAGYRAAGGDPNDICPDWKG
ncbi:hypothetical protein [Falsiroseomonas sp. CW058]|uniref:hypothetical protein n=1 Tax=Falsiroseomonas sp. CW058 TaxID=3388664 RepID=UPI003D3131A7